SCRTSGHSSLPPSRTKCRSLINCVKREIGFAAYLSRGVNSSLLRAGERRDEDLRIDKKVAGGRSRRNSEKILETVPYKIGDDCFSPLFTANVAYRMVAMASPKSDSGSVPICKNSYKYNVEFILL